MRAVFARHGGVGGGPRSVRLALSLGKWLVAVNSRSCREVRRRNRPRQQPVSRCPKGWVGRGRAVIGEGGRGGLWVGMPTGWRRALFAPECFLDTFGDGWAGGRGMGGACLPSGLSAISRRSTSMRRAVAVFRNRDTGPHIVAKRHGAGSMAETVPSYAGVLRDLHGWHSQS